MAGPKNAKTAKNLGGSWLVAERTGIDVTRPGSGLDRGQS